MRTGVAATTAGYFHETTFYDSDEALLSVVVPFLEEGVAAGEPTVVTFGRRNRQLVESALSDRSGITFVPGEARYVNPATTIRTYREAFAAYVAAGANQIRVVGDVPHPGMGVPWDGWARYEAAVNHAYDDFPVWGLCPYDTRTTPPAVLDEVRRTHPHEARPDGSHRHNPEFADPRGFLVERPPAPPDPAELTTPAIVLHDPDSASARRAVAAVASRSLLGAEQLAGLELAVSEVVTNALTHGTAPCLVRAWLDSARRVVVAVHDGGRGPGDAFAGLLGPSGPGPGGHGLWIAHQACADVTLRREDDGFTVVLVAGDLVA